MFVNTTRKFTCERCSNVPKRFKQKWDPCVQETFDKPSLDTTQKECDHPKTLEIVNRIEQSIVTALTTIHDSSQEEKIKILNSQIDDLKSEKEKHLSSLADEMAGLSFDTNVIQSLSKNNNVVEAIKALNKNTFKMSQTLQNTSEMLQRSSANNKDLSQSISTLTQKVAVQNASDNASSVKKNNNQDFIMYRLHLPTCQHQTVLPCWPI